eukprot:11513308-Ditylum_brightwellii.AAC.1
MPLYGKTCPKGKRSKWPFFVDGKSQARNEKHIDKAIANMILQGFELRIEDDAAGFLGIDLVRQDDGSIELKQMALIKRIIKMVRLQTASFQPTPAEVKELPSDKLGPGLQENWPYSPIIGMFMYLASNSRPDKAMAVHQCARYTHNPFCIHEVAVKRFVHYLIGTKDTREGQTGYCGMFINPTDDLTLD